MKIIYLFILIFYSLCSLCQKIVPSKETRVEDQSKSSLNYFNLGVKYFEKYNFKGADSLYALSILAKPNIDAYYNLAVTKIKEGDTCSSCHNLKKASILGDETATTYYSRFCSFDDERMERFYKANEARYISSLNSIPSLDNYLNLAIANAKLGDQCGFCNNLQKTFTMGFFNPKLVFKKYCCKQRDITINDTTNKNYKITNHVFTYKCNENINLENTFYRIRKNNGIMNNDTIYSFSTLEVKKGIITDIETKDYEDSSFVILKIDTTQVSGDYIDDFSVNKILRTHGESPILLIVEVMPSFPEGEEGLYKFLADNIKYPQVARETGISGTVVVQFVVEMDGSITQVALLKDIGGGCGDEAMRVAHLMPKWIPGKQNGKPARVQYQLPVRFQLD